MGDSEDLDQPAAAADSAAGADDDTTTESPTIVEPTLVEMDAPASPKRSRGALVAGIVGVVALLATGTFAIVKIAGDGDDGGAASPGEVGTELLAALEEEDLLGVVDLLLPSERETLRQPMIDLVDDLKRLEVLAADASLDDVGGLDLRFDGVEVAEQPTNVADITNIVLSGTGAVVVNGAQVPIGDFLIDEVFDGERPDLDSSPESDDFDDVQLTTVERDGRWYLSAFYSIAETARGEDQDIPTAGLAAQGAEEPELAVDAMLDALVATDVTAMVALLDPTEAEALHRYAPLFLAEAEEGADDVPVEATITDVQYSVSGEGDRRSIGIDSIAVTLTPPEEEEAAGPITLTYAAGCLVVAGMGEESTEVCGTQFDQMDEFAEDSGLIDSQASQEFFAAISDAFADFEARGVAVHEVDGSWYVSPLRSWFDNVDSVLNALERPEIERIVDAATAMFDDIFSQTECAVQLPADDIADGDDSELDDDGCAA